ncbi:hypothetical protein BKA69DRAFT_180320 [Paraphysoderma sedebokerense]|nr:hypothetical protein BKA69DRAFT_180320 [Paraphysoderma sedebokerense]
MQPLKGGFKFPQEMLSRQSQHRISIVILGFMVGIKEASFPNNLTKSIPLLNSAKMHKLALLVVAICVLIQCITAEPGQFISRPSHPQHYRNTGCQPQQDFIRGKCYFKCSIGFIEINDRCFEQCNYREADLGNSCCDRKTGHVRHKRTIMRRWTWPSRH